MECIIYVPLHHLNGNPCELIGQLCILPVQWWYNGACCLLQGVAYCITLSTIFAVSLVSVACNLIQHSLTGRSLVCCVIRTPPTRQGTLDSPLSLQQIYHVHSESFCVCIDQSFDPQAFRKAVVIGTRIVYRMVWCACFWQHYIFAIKFLPWVCVRITLITSRAKKTFLFSVDSDDIAMYIPTCVPSCHSSLSSSRTPSGSLAILL